MVTQPAATRYGDVDPGAEHWLTTLLRPVGPLDKPALRRLTETLGRLAATSDAIIVDLTATQVPAPRAVATGLHPPARAAQRAGRCLLLVGASPGLVAELERAGVPVATLPSELL